jgi:hypothetical protein
VTALIKTFTVIHVGGPNEVAPYAVAIAEEAGRFIVGRADGADLSWLHVGAAVASSESEGGVRVFKCPTRSPEG